MFGRKKRKRLLKIWDNEGKTLFCDELNALEIPESLILSLSKEFFNDPNPCEIHRSAVMTRVFMEFEEALKVGERRETWTLPKRLRECLPDDAEILGIFEEENA